MITLTKDMETGVVLIDNQHRELVSRLNAVLSMGAKSVSGEETQKTLDFLGNYIATHFSDEEKLQTQSDYPDQEWHKSQHQLYIKEFQKLKQEFAAHGISVKFTLALNNSIVQWIVRHIKAADMKFAMYYQACAR